MPIRTHPHVCALWFCTSVETLERRNSIWPACVQWDHGTRPLDTLETAAPRIGLVKITSFGRACAHVTTTKLDALPCTTIAATLAEMADTCGPTMLLELSVSSDPPPPKPNVRSPSVADCAPPGAAARPFGAFGPPPLSRAGVFTGMLPP